jgi:hypothetical protein
MKMKIYYRVAAIRSGSPSVAEPETAEITLAISRCGSAAAGNLRKSMPLVGQSDLELFGIWATIQPLEAHNKYPGNFCIRGISHGNATKFGSS